MVEVVKLSSKMANCLAKSPIGTSNFLLGQVSLPKRVNNYKENEGDYVYHCHLLPVDFEVSKDTSLAILAIRAQIGWIIQPGFAISYDRGVGLETIFLLLLKTIF
ncbi:hypothetical protein KFK09_026746 [Dendrobium nobile]|uniref:Uncharacterized protein n=1 Tax=Dendrobium nobile TaxID=94219 RepID=A0A8T3A8Q4_DENNO|nr:hypothetical protein KFK09_026746 [Dendrobium nobile]